MRGAIFAIELASSTAYHDVSLREHRTPHFQPDVRSLVEIGRFVTAADYLKAEQYRWLLMEAFRDVFETGDSPRARALAVARTFELPNAGSSQRTRSLLRRATPGTVTNRAAGVKAARRTSLLAPGSVSRDLERRTKDEEHTAVAVSPVRQIPDASSAVMIATGTHHRVPLRTPTWLFLPFEKESQKREHALVPRTAIPLLESNPVTCRYVVLEIDE